MEDISYEYISEKLLKEGYYLTALEFFAELCESGKDLPQILKDFASSKSSEVEATNIHLERSCSLQTFDSLDLTRNSEDGERTRECIAVLEFELRRARETINSLKENLTSNYTSSLQEGDVNDSDKGLRSVQPFFSDPIKPQEKKALNFLIHEYLVKHNYRMSSVTFSEEIDDQALDDWADVGLSIEKPPDLLSFYRTYWVHCNQCKVEEEYFKPSKDDSVSDLKDSSKDKERAVDEKPSNLTVMLQTEAIATLEAETQTDEVFFSESKPLLADIESTFPGKLVPSENCVFSFYHKSFNLSVQDEEEGKEGKEENVPLLINCCEDALNLNEFQAAVFALTERFDPRKLAKGPVTPQLIEETIAKDLIGYLTDSLAPIIANYPKRPRKKEVLLRNLFNIYKKPNLEQRQEILEAFSGLAFLWGPDTTAESILPVLWEDINTRQKEKRLLIAEIIGSLVPFLPFSIRSSLLLSILDQIVKDQKFSVKLAGLKSLTILISFLVEKIECYKITDIINMVLAELEDFPSDDEQQNDEPASSIHEYILNVMLPVCCRWGMMVGRLKCSFVDKYLEKMCSLKEDKSSVIQRYIGGLKKILPFILAEVVNKMPGNISKIDDSKSDLQSIPLFYSFLKQNQLCEEEKMKNFIILTKSEEYPNWPELEWLLDIYVKILIPLIPKIGLETEPLHCFVEILEVINEFLSEQILIAKVKPAFSTYFRTSSEPKGEVGDSFINALLPVYFHGFFMSIPGLFTNFNYLTELNSFLQEGLVAVSLYNHLLHSFEMTINLAFMKNKSEAISILVSFLRDTLMHSNSSVRQNIANLYRTVCLKAMEVQSKDLLSASTIKSSILPSLITLSSDVELEVRAASIPGFSALVNLLRARIISDDTDIVECWNKAQLQLASYFEDQLDCDQHLIQLELIRMLTQVASHIGSCKRSNDDYIKKEFDSNFVQFAIPRLSALVAHCGNNLTNKTKKRDFCLALLSAYGSFSAIPHDTIADQSIEEALLPSLRCVRDIITQVAPDYKEAANFLINEFERRVNLANSMTSGIPTSPLSKASPSSPTTPVIGLPSANISAIANNQMVDEVKNRVRGILNKSSSVSSAAHSNLKNMFKRR